MARHLVDLADLVGTAEIAARLGVRGPHVVHGWRKRYDDFPEPVVTISSVLIWLWPEVQEWAERTGRLRR